MLGYLQCVHAFAELTPYKFCKLRFLKGESYVIVLLFFLVCKVYMFVLKCLKYGVFLTNVDENVSEYPNYKKK